MGGTSTTGGSLADSLRTLLELPSKDGRGTGGPGGTGTSCGQAQKSGKKYKGSATSQSPSREASPPAESLGNTATGDGESEGGIIIHGPQVILERAIATLDTLGRDFVDLREQDRAKAYLAFQRGLMSNLGTLSPVIPAKDIVGLAMDIEHYLKGITSSSGIAPEKQMQEFLTSVESGETA